LVGVVIIVVVTHWLLPRVVFPWLAARRPRPPAPEAADSGRWALTAVAGLTVYLVIGIAFRMSAAGLAIWGVAFVAVMASTYRRLPR
jgi:hypothetical protein